MEDTDEFKWAVKVVIKRQMRDLITQLQESGDEVAILAVNLEEESCSLFGSPTGEWFLSEQKNLSHSFLNFCKAKAKKSDSDSGLTAPSTPTSSTKGPSQKADGTSNSSYSAKPQRATQGRKPKHLAIEPKPCLINVTIPASLAPEATEKELASLAGRVFATKVIAGRLHDHATKFDDLVEAINMRDMKNVKQSGTGQGTPSKRRKLNTGNSVQKDHTRSGRKVSSKFQRTMNSLKKIKNESATDAAEENKDAEKEAEDKSTVEFEEDFKLLKEICDVDPVALKRFHVCTSDWSSVNVMRTELPDTPELEAVAMSLILVVNTAMHGASILELRDIKLIVSKEETCSKKIEVEIADAITEKANIKLEKSLDSEDESNEMDSTGDGMDDYLYGEYDPDEAESPSVSVIETSSKPKEAKSLSIGQKRTSLEGLVRKQKKRSATELMLMKCDECGISVTGRSNLKSHYKRIHLHVRNFMCTICNKGFWSNNARESHMLSVHTRKCDACQEYVVESVPWGKGVTMRTKRDVICTCGSIVSIYSMFGRRRMYLRDDEPDADGNVKQASRKSNSGTKYACGTCGKLFMKKSNCERHSRAHIDMKVCVCNLCGSQYTYESSLKKHMQTEHGVVKHVCELCFGNYSSLTALKVHMVKAHHNVAIGDNVAIVVQDENELMDEDLHEVQEAFKGKTLEATSQPEGAATVMKVSASSSRDETPRSQPQPQQVYIQTPSGQHLLVSTSDPALLAAQTSAPHTADVGTSLVQGEDNDSTVGELQLEGLVKNSSVTEVEVENEGGSGELELDTDGVGAQRVVITTEGGDGELSQARTSEIVQEVLRSSRGQLVTEAGEGGAVSIIIKQLPVETEQLQ